MVAYTNGENNTAPVVLTDNTTQLDVETTDTATQSGQISETGGSWGLAKIGTGTLILSNANTYSGGTNINAGTVQLDNIAGAGTGLITLNNTSALRLNTSGTLTDNLTVNGNDTISATAGNTVTLSPAAFNLATAFPTPAQVHFGTSVDTGTILFGSTGLTGLNTDSSIYVDGACGRPTSRSPS